MNKNTKMSIDNDHPNFSESKERLREIQNFPLEKISKRVDEFIAWCVALTPALALGFALLAAVDFDPRKFWKK